MPALHLFIKTVDSNNLNIHVTSKQVVYSYKYQILIILLLQSVGLHNESFAGDELIHA